MAVTSVALQHVPPELPLAARRKRTTTRRPRPAALKPTSRVGAWRVDGELGRGGMATVYAVTHTQFGKRAALKVAHRAVIGPEFTPQTFLREARIVHLVDHPGVPDVFATGSYDTRPYLVMERLTGETLGQRLDAGRLTKAEGIRILIEVCEILGASHRAGIVHRDIKLDNIFIETNGRVRVLDWGVARVLSEDDPLRGMIAGTLTYVPPEQILGDDITPAADVYSLGVLAYHVLLGAPPFVGDTDLDLIRKHLHDTPPAPPTRWPDIPPDLARVLWGMLAKQPVRRPTLDIVMRTLAATRLERPRRTWLPPKPQRAYHLLASVAAAVAGAIAAFSV